MQDNLLKSSLMSFIFCMITIIKKKDERKKRKKENLIYIYKYEVKDRITAYK